MLDRLEWDVKMYLALNGAVHDAAITAWGLKRKYDSVRPISMIRYMGGIGQSSDPDGPSYAPDGLPLAARADRGDHRRRRPRRAQRHAAPRRPRGRDRDLRLAGDRRPIPTTETGGVRWIRAVEWVPYQKRTFVTPAFPGLHLGPQHLQPRRRRGA